MTRPVARDAGARATAALALTGVTKRFGDVVALRDASLVVRPGTVHALLGENGAGKSTLVNVAFGLVAPDAGEVRVHGAARSFASPADAIAAGLGMVHQHFRLVAAMTVAENVALGRRGRFDRRAVAGEIASVGEATGLRIDPHATVGTLGVAAQQRVEIVKALVRGARLLVLDEPTAVLAPDEADELLAWLRRWAASTDDGTRHARIAANDASAAPDATEASGPADAETASRDLSLAMAGGTPADLGGRAAVLITHRLREALRHADDVTVLRRGASVLASPTRALDAPTLLAAMLGADAHEFDVGGGMTPTGGRARDGVPPHSDHAPESPPPRNRTAARAADPPRPSRHPPRPTPVVLRLDAATVRDERGILRLHPTTLDVRAGEILGVAAVEGAGHHELLRLLAGRLRPTSGTAELPDRVGLVPEDRQRDALLLDASVTDNVLLRDSGRRRGLLALGQAATDAAAIIGGHDVRDAAPDTPARALSGGNQQRLVLGRELRGDPPAVVAESPTRGLDVRAAADVLDRLRDARDRGAAVVLFLPDLDELLALADRVVVVHAGRVREAPTDRATVGRLLVGAG